MVGFAFVGLTQTGIGIAETEEHVPIFPQVDNWNALIVSFVAIFALLLAEAMPRVLTGEPRLPNVKIAATSTDPDDEPVVGTLLDHTDESWYFFDEQWTLKVIPDGQVKAAQVLRGE